MELLAGLFPRRHPGSNPALSGGVNTSRVQIARGVALLLEPTSEISIWRLVHGEWRHGLLNRRLKEIRVFAPKPSECNATLVAFRESVSQPRTYPRLRYIFSFKPSSIDTNYRRQVLMDTDKLQGSCERYVRHPYCSGSPLLQHSLS